MPLCVAWFANLFLDGKKPTKMISARLWNNHHRIFFFFSVLSHGVKDNERQRRDREKSCEGESRALETEGESLNLSSSLWVQDERRIDGWIIGTKPQRASLQLLSWKLPDFLSAEKKSVKRRVILFAVEFLWPKQTHNRWCYWRL